MPRPAPNRKRTMPSGDSLPGAGGGDDNHTRNQTFASVPPGAPEAGRGRTGARLTALPGLRLPTQTRHSGLGQRPGARSAALDFAGPDT